MPTRSSLYGTDGCPSGWVVCNLDAAHTRIETTVHVGILDVLRQLDGNDVLVIDIPIGLLPERVPGGRECDRIARRLIGPRRSSVFSAPCRPALRANGWDEARAFGLTKQGHAILPKIAAVDKGIDPFGRSMFARGAPNSRSRGWPGGPCDTRRSLRPAERSDSPRWRPRVKRLTALHFATYSKVHV
jgi:hypothetical protein